MNNQITEIAFTKSNLPFGWMGNMSNFRIIYKGIEWKSTEALFQAMRFPENSPIREEIRLASNGFTAKLVAKANRDWMSVIPTSEEDLANMRLCIKLKIEQHSELKEILLGSGEIPIYEDVTARGPKNSNLFWGAMKLPDGTWEGTNILGNMWMELRTELKNQLKSKPINIETERRFLLKRLPNIKWDDELSIHQIYLSENGADNVVRIRKTQRDLPTNIEYTQTTKTRISNMSSEEKEIKITRDDYVTLSVKEKRSIRKTRFIKNVDDGLKWEVDLLGTRSDIVGYGLKLVIAEIELPTETYELNIPDWIKEVLIMEVTGINQFSNSNLAE